MGFIETVDIKKEELRLELERKGSEQNKFKIKRLRESIERNKKISRIIKKMGNKRRR